jgi:hypothetical protein
MSKLYELTGNYLRLQDMAAEGILDEATFRDTLASIEGDISDKADGYEN